MALLTANDTLAAGKTTLLYVTRADWSFYSHAFVQP